MAINEMRLEEENKEKEEEEEYEEMGRMGVGEVDLQPLLFFLLDWCY